MDSHSLDTELAVAPATDEYAAIELEATVQQYVDRIVTREVETARNKLAARSTWTDEETAVCRELAHAIATELVTERMQMMGSEELDDEQRERIAALFGLSTVDIDGEGALPAADQ